MRKLRLTSVVATLAVAASLQAAVWSPTNLLSTGDMEAPSDWAWGTGTSSSSDQARSGTLSGAIISTGAANRTFYGDRTTASAITTVANRAHYLNYWTRGTGSLSGGFVRGVAYWNWSALQYSFFGSNYTAPFTTGWGQRGATFRPSGSGVIDDLVVGLNARTGSSTVYIDDISVMREITSPLASRDSLDGSGLNVGQLTAMTLYNDAGVDGDYNVFFDPDVQVAADNATISDVVWVSDTEVNFNITQTSAGLVTLTLTNGFGEKSAEYVVVPEPASLSLAVFGAIGMLMRKRAGRK